MKKAGLGVLCTGLFAVPFTLGSARAQAAPVASAAYVAVGPCRLADTRLGFPHLDAQTLQIATRGACGIPANATSVALTLTVVYPQAPGFLTAWPADRARPVVSNVNFAAGQIRANGSITRVDSRPSDAIAIALRLDAPMFASESLLVLPDDDEEDDESKSTFIAPPSDEGAELSAEQLKEHLEHLRPEDFGKFNL